ncbi:hypothetical protein Back2_05890 [Nocardioides baekrokdamisoli]|uniref:Uncharacterized protein n=1 Tax=Nocardioides baekrokdamisoli TaxID=1804624 RepID=A0A3G9ID47_9ACTN|nr:hypothetical protein [Nocardioides baekrokdamisoli]BBH16302.1 hypothetical protein Back2_05890 [Nocardioides baekrokdamisoli]
MVSPLNMKVAAGAAALLVGIIGGAYVAGAASPQAQTPVVSWTTPSRVASPSAPAIQVYVPTIAPRATLHKPDQHPPEHAKHHSHGNGD